MSVSLPLEDLAGALAGRSNAAYLLTVSDDGQAHCVASTLEWTGDELLVPAGPKSERNAAARGTVVLLAPPVGGLLAREGSQETALDTYSLIVDAEVTGTSSAEVSPAEVSPAEVSPAEVSPAEVSPAEVSPAEASPAASREGGWVRLRPVHAVFHRPAEAPSGRLHDCVHLYDEPAPAS